MRATTDHRRWTTANGLNGITQRRRDARMLRNDLKRSLPFSLTFSSFLKVNQYNVLR